MFSILMSEFFDELRKQKIRAFLTISSMAWGTFTITLLLAFGSGLSNAFMKGMLGAGNQILMVYGGQTNLEYQGLGKGRRVSLVEDDAVLLKKSIPQIDMISPSYGKWIQVKSGTSTVNTYCEAVNPGFQDMRTMYPTQGGRFLTEKDMNESRRVAVVGHKIAEEVFGTKDVVGKSMMIDDQPYTIVGVLQSKMQMGMSMGPDSRRVIMPFTTFKSIYGYTNIRSVVVHISNPEMHKVVERKIFETLGRKYKFDPKDERALGVWDMVEGQKMMSAIGTGFTIFLGAIGLLTLIVAGVGIANIMYVVVKERTREIGIRKAIGARRIHISSQFIMESLMLSFIGGIIGLGITFIIVKAAWLVPSNPDSNVDPIEMLARPVISLTTMFSIFSILTVIGLMAGYFPARKAASVDPVESLRYE